MRFTSRLDALERRLTQTNSAALRVYFKDGSSRITSAGNAIPYFKSGEAVKVELVRGQTGFLCDLLNGLNNEGSTNHEKGTF